MRIERTAPHLAETYFQVSFVSFHFVNIDNRHCFPIVKTLYIVWPRTEPKQLQIWGKIRPNRFVYAKRLDANAEFMCHSKFSQKERDWHMHRKSTTHTPTAVQTIRMWSVWQVLHSFSIGSALLNPHCEIQQQSTSLSYRKGQSGIKTAAVLKQRLYITFQHSRNFAMKLPVLTVTRWLMKQQLFPGNVFNSTSQTVRLNGQNFDPVANWWQDVLLFVSCLRASALMCHHSRPHHSMYCKLWPFTPFTSIVAWIYINPCGFTNCCLSCLTVM